MLQEKVFFEARGLKMNILLVTDWLKKTDINEMVSISDSLILPSYYLIVFQYFLSSAFLASLAVFSSGQSSLVGSITTGGGMFTHST